MSGTQYSFNPQLYATGEDGPSWRANALANAGFATVDLVIQPPCRGIYVGTAGDVAVTMAGGRFETAQAGQGPTDAQVNDITVFKNVPAGTVLPIMITALFRTTGGTNGNTTAQDLILLY